MRDESNRVATGVDSLKPTPFASPRTFGGWDEKAFDADDSGGADDDAEEASDSSLIPHPSSLSICLVSGGMDSCVTAAIAREESEEVAFLHVSYGQRTEARERRAFEELAEAFGVARRLVVSLEHLARIGGSSLTDTTIPVTEADLSSREIPTSYVPFRNVHLLAA